MRFRSHFRLAAVIPTFVMASCRTDLADSAGMPWETPMEKVLRVVNGPVPVFVGIAVIVLAGVGFLRAEDDQATRRYLRIIIATIFVFFATHVVGWLASFFGVAR